MDSLTMLNVAVRIFPNGSMVRDKFIYVNIEKVKKMPIIADNLDVQNCTFWYVNKSTKADIPIAHRIKMFWYFNVLGKSHFIRDWK